MRLRYPGDPSVEHSYPDAIFKWFLTAGCQVESDGRSHELSTGIIASFVSSILDLSAFEVKAHSITGD
jgi:hypothetical protein